MADVHAVLLPQVKGPYDPKNPVAGFQNPHELAIIRDEADKLQAIVASKMMMKYDSKAIPSTSENAVPQGKAEVSQLKESAMVRDWKTELLVGVRAIPTINRLSVEVLSPDLVSDNIKTTSHYNTFVTPFFISLNDFPISKQELQRRKDAVRQPLRCLRCETSFGADLVKLKEHLESKWKYGGDCTLQRLGN